jgi:hypothetical protein
MASPLEFRVSTFSLIVIVSTPARLVVLGRQKEIHEQL